MHGRPQAPAAPAPPAGLAESGLQGRSGAVHQHQQRTPTSGAPCEVAHSTFQLNPLVCLGRHSRACCGGR